MQVTPEMIEAARGSLGRFTLMTDFEIAKMVHAALTVAGEVAVDVTANIRIQVDETEFRDSVADAVERLNDALPRNADGRITLATLHGAPAPMVIPDGHPLLDTSSSEDPMAMAMQHRMPVTEPRPLATVGELHHHLGESREFVLHAAAGMPEYDPPFPDPVREYGEDREPLYDPQAVKAWYDALPQAADG